MAKAFNDITGRVFGRLTAVRFTGKDRDSNRMWLCKCECGTQKEVIGFQLVRGSVKSCGCLVREHRSKWPKTFVKHGKCNSREYRSWQAMKHRCYNKNDKCYSGYGGRGIAVCSRWRNSFIHFIEDMGPCPSGMQLDRIDNNKGYSVCNCRWATGSQNCNNTRRNVVLELYGQRYTLTEWSRIVSTSLQTLWWRRYQGWSDRDVILGKNL